MTVFVTPFRKADGPSFQVVIDDGTDRTIELAVEMDDQHPPDADPRMVCTAVRISCPDGLQARDLRFPYDEYLARVRRHPAFLDQGKPRDARTKRRRRELTDTFLREVADIYSSAPPGGRTQAVRDVHPASESQVYRWLQAARDRGILTDEGD